jgi:phosphoglycerol transferase MdoB-like AlkP superfamily enzyme
LFDRALEYFDERSSSGQPFFSLIMTTSNHKPFTFREGLPDIPASGGGRVAGVRYADFALGYFLKSAEQHKWFDNTVFVVVADHGARVYGKVDIPLRTYEVPIFVYAPARIKPRQVDTLMGQIDIAPTVLGLLGLEYEAPFFGTDILACGECQRTLFFNHNYDVAVLRDGKLAVLGLGKSVQNLTYDAASDSYAVQPDDPELTNMAVAFYQTAYEQFQNQTYK